MKMLILLISILFSFQVYSSALSPELIALAQKYEKSKVSFSEQSIAELDSFKLMAQEVVSVEAAKKFSKIISLSQVEMSVFSEGGLLGEMKSAAVQELNDQKINKIELSFQGETFHKINIKASQVIAYKNIIFVKTSEGLFFLNLKEYRGSLALSEIPMFKLPLETKLLEKDIRIENNKLLVGEVELSKELIRIYTDAQKIAFRISANLVDPKFYSEALPVIEALKKYFSLTYEAVGKSLGEQASAAEAMNQKIKMLQDQIKEDFKKQEMSLQEFGELTEEQRKELLEKFSRQSVDNLEKEMLEGKELQEKYQKATETLGNTRKLTTRLHWIWARMSMPSPNAARKIKSSLAYIKKTLVYKNALTLNTTFNALSSKSKRNIALGSSVLSASVGAYLGMQYQIDLAGFLHQSFSTTKAVLDSVFGEFSTLKNVAYTSSEAAKATVSSFNPFVVKEAYFNSEVLPKLGVGLAAIVSSLYVVIGTPHIVINSIKLYQDLKAKHYTTYYQYNLNRGQGEARAKLTAFYQTFFNKEHFIDRQREYNKRYLDVLSSAHNNGLSSEFTELEDKEVEKVLEELQKAEANNRGFLTRFLGKINVFKYLKKNKDETKSKEIKTFRQAFKNFLFSYASFTQTGYVYTTIWNKWFIFRSFILRPSTWYTFLAYPNYYQKIVTPVEGVETQMPTKFNGGTQSRISKYLSKLDIERLSAWEKQIFSLEEKVHNEAIKKAFLALSDSIKKDKELKQLLESGVIKSIFDKRVKKLKSKQQKYFQNVFQSLFNHSMEKILKRANITVEGRSFDITDINNLTIEDIQRVEQIKDVEKIVEEEWKSNKQKILAEAKGGVKDSFIRPSLSILRNSAATARVQSTNKHGKNPLRMAQAVRYMIAKNLVDKPMELMFMFIGLSAIQASGLGQDLIRPIQDAMFSENSWFHLSRFSFLNGFLVGVVTGVMADVWYKLQVGENIKSDIGEVPSKLDAKKSYFRWYMKMTSDSSNTWWKNQKHYVKLIYANMPAALVTFMTFNFVTLGRFDVDSYLIGYLAAYLLPTSGFNYKLENGFELASGYFYKDIPEKFRSHPKVQEFVGNLTHKKRLGFNMLYTTYENILGMLIFTVNSMETEKLGTRSLTRSLFGGWTVTEKIAESSEKLQNYLHGSSIPGKEGLAKVVDVLCKPITNNFTDWSKFKPRD